jgi:predicted aspartyl protease
MALTSFVTLPGAAFQAPAGQSVAELLSNDEVDRAEALLDNQPRTAEAVAFRGEIEYRRGNFERAASLYNEALKMDQASARGHFGLGKLALAKLKGKEAIQSFKRAIELSPREPQFRLYASEAWALEKNVGEQRKELEEYIRLNPDDPDRLSEAKAGLEMLQALGTGEVGAIEAPEVPAPIRFRKSLNLIFTNVMVNGAGPYDFAIDTGASQTVLSEKLASELGLMPVTTTIMHGVGGTGKVESKVYRIDEMAIGDVKVRNLPVGTFNDPLLTQLADGILGTAMLSDFVITINFPENLMELSRKADLTRTNTIPVWYFYNLLLVSLEVNGQHRGNFVVDTGAVTTVLSHGMARELGVDEHTEGAKIDLGIAGVGGVQGVVLRVPNVNLKTPHDSELFPQVVAIDLKQISRMIGTEVAGVIGYDFLEGYRLTLDYQGAQIGLTK